MSESVEQSYPEVWRRRLARRRLAGQLLYAGVVLLVAGAVGSMENVPWLAASGLLVLPILVASYLLRLFAGPYRCPRCGHIFTQQTIKNGPHASFRRDWLTQSCLHCQLPLTSPGPITDPARPSTDRQPPF